MVLCVIFCGIGVFLLIANLVNERKGKSSGIPLFGGLFTALGLLMSPMKWLAIPGLFFDYLTWALFYSFVIDRRRFKKEAAKFGEEYEKHSFVPGQHDSEKNLTVRIKEREEELIWPFMTSKVYLLRVPRIYFSICEEEDGHRFLLLDIYMKNSRILLMPFDGNVISFDVMESETENYHIELLVGKQNGISDHKK